MKAEYDFTGESIGPRPTIREVEPTPSNPLSDVAHRATFANGIVGHLRTAVELEQMAAKPGLEPWEVGYKTKYSRIHFEQMRKKLPEIKKEISKLTLVQAKILEDYCELTVPDAIKDQKKNHPLSDSPWQVWLGGDATEEELLGFLEWHVGWIEAQQQDPEVTAAFNAQKELYKTQLLATLDTEYWLHEDAAEALTKIDEIKMYAGDVFDTWMNGILGYHEPGSTEIVIAADTRLDAEGNHMKGIIKNIEEAAFHELNHAVLGQFRHRWINEALTEHICLALKTGQPEVVSPNLRDRPGESYLNERKLLAVLLKGVIKPIDAHLATRAYSEKSKLGPANREFTDALEREWGRFIIGEKPVLDLVDSYIAKVEKDLLLKGTKSDGITPFTMRQATTKAIKQTIEDIQDPDRRYLIFDPYRDTVVGARF
jgi:hypothetical protein